MAAVPAVALTNNLWVWGAVPVVALISNIWVWEAVPVVEAMADLVGEDLEDMEDIMEGIMAAVADTVDREVVDTVDREVVDTVDRLAVEVLMGQEVVVVVDDGKRELVL
ncbi:hypothetical protein J010_01445 [Cryptococcus neoformans]|nr:heterogeneous nuclear ribonucleoprotein F/H [Cryptococcus neoformans var. grubii AD1-83a]OXG53007.1 heterogeneous nuclear ribonucleoprotein F/H [Cryptococcus neoformans var. grubii Th84]OXG65483.1 heterogeneous nuclear ribonucleoprotein F/H [Cryptococcus neoformans var. grubii MW-RSA1955]OXG67451.1 heterogeneous nuclear ribonucleoprotein F/H [Cryptococcus neoformans var. grubii c8]OXG98878.1 heterogeneous nuclear ribonucleoprotein F/H [Cryptococcus neoformans var. grubii A2-102-5]OXH16048.1